jgi:transposase-like protein
MRNFPDPRGYWSEKEGRRAVEAWRRSGESSSAFARRHGIRAKRLKWWSERLAPAAPSPTVSFVPATVVEPEHDELAVVIRIPSGIAIEIASATPATIASIATMLAKSS